ncbi:MAG: methyltransferase [Chloroflexales bacterium]
MDHHEMVALIHDGVPRPGGVWADLGAGTGNFTWALADMLGPQGVIHALDRDRHAIAAQVARAQHQPPAAAIIPCLADVTRPLELPPLDGLLLANLLHFIRDQTGLLQRLAGHLQPAGQLLIVEYEQRLPLPWVPFPVPFVQFTELARAAGFAQPRHVGIRRSPSSGRVLYAAVTERQT